MKWNYRPAFAFLVAACTLAAHLAPTASAATRTWNGSFSGYWTNVLNWTPAGSPQNGDGLVFPANASRLMMTNVLLPPSNFVFLHFSGSNYVLYSSVLSVTNGLTNAPDASQSNILRAPISLGANQTWSLASKTILSLQSNWALGTFALTLDGVGQMDVRGNLTGAAGSSLLKMGGGTLILDGPANSVPDLRVFDGRLLVNGVLSGGLSISNGAILSGAGTVPPFACAGTVRPGGAAPGVLTVSAGGVASFTSGSTLQFNVQGTTPGLNHDQLRVSSPPNLSGATLSVLLSTYTPLPGDTFVLITNTSGSAFTTAFAGRPEGSAITVGSTRFVISYAGGNGNDVTLRVVPTNLFNGTLDLCQAVEIVPAFFLPKPLGWANVGTRSISGPYEDEMSSEPWAGPAPTPVTTNGNANPPSPGGCNGADCAVFFRPFSGNAADGTATGHLYQDVAATPGLNYALIGWAGAEANALMARAEFALEFLNVSNVIVGASVLDLIPAGLFVPNGQPFNYKQFAVSGTAPPNATIVRARISMINGSGNPAGGGQAFVVDDFNLLTVNEPVITSQPQSRTNYVGATATFSVGAVGAGSLTYQWRRGSFSLANGGNISGATSPTLTLSSVLLSDAATNYAVVISNAFGAVTSVLATLTVVAVPTNNLLFNPHLDFCQAVEIVPGFFLPKPSGWANVGTRSSTGPYEDEMSSEPWAGPAPTPVTTFGNSNPPSPEGCGGPDCAVFFKPFSGNSSPNGAATGHLYQDNPATPGWTYTLTGWAGAEANALMTRAEFALEFFNSVNALIGGASNNLSANGLFVANGQAFNYKQYTVMAAAPSNAVTVRARASMIGATGNPAGGGQAFVIDDFSLTAQVVARPRITSIRVVLPGGAKRITAQGEPNHIYTLQTAGSLATPVSWSNFTSTNANASGDFEFSDAGAAGRRFYRLLVP